MTLKVEYPELPDAQLILLLKESDGQAFTEIIKRYHVLLFSFANRRLDDRELARDFVHDVFTNIWEKRTRLGISGVLEAYLVQSIKNRLFDHFKHGQVTKKYVEQFSRQLEASQNNTDHLVRHNELSRLIEKEIAALPERMRVVYELSRIKAMSRKEISEHLNIPENTVKTALQRGLKVLRLRLQESSMAVFLLFLVHNI